MGRDVIALDAGLELSRLLNQAMQRFDALPRASQSEMAEAASRDLRNQSANRRLFGLLGLAACGVVLWGVSRLAPRWTGWLAKAGVDLSISQIIGMLLLCLIACGYAAFWRGIRRRRQRLAEATPHELQQVLAHMAQFRLAMHRTHPLLAENLQDVSRRMVKLFGSPDRALAARLLAVSGDVIGSEEFERLCGADAELSRHRSHLLAVMNAGARHLALPAGPQAT